MIQTFDIIFTTNISQSMRFKSFTVWHLLIMLFFLSLIFAAVYFTRKHSANPVKTLKTCAIALPIMYLFRFTVFILLDIFVEPQMSIIDRLPFHLCALNAIVMPIAVFRQSRLLLNYSYMIALPAAFLAMLTPAMSYYGTYFYLSWQIIFFYADHALMMLTPILGVSIGFFKPDYKYLPKVLLLLLSYSALIYPINKLFDQNFLFLNYPDNGTVFALFASSLGNPGYLVPTAILAIVITIAMMLPWYIKERRLKATTEAAPEIADEGE